MIGRLLRGLRRHGPLGSVRAARYILIEAPRARRQRPSQKPTVKDLVRSTASIEVSAEELLRRLGVEVSDELSRLADERVEELERRTTANELLFPERFAVERESARFLYLLVRTTRPELMVETGVANGASTFLVLTAMDENGVGRLVSTDITDGVGSLLDDRERASDRWELRVIAPDGFRDLAEEVGTVDVFLHDSDHSYANVHGEVSAIWPHVRSGGFVVADDGELCFGLLDAVEGTGAEVRGLFDRRKVLLVTRR